MSLVPAGKNKSVFEIWLELLLPCSSGNFVADYKVLFLTYTY